MTTLTRSALLAYGLFGLPLALVALPIYVYVPQFYAERFGMSLGVIGIALLGARLFDAFIDPLIGLWVDRVKSRNGFGGPYGVPILAGLPALCFGFAGLFNPPAQARDFSLLWFVGCLLLVYAGFSIATIAYQSWGAALTQAPSQRSRVTAMREGCGLVGVILAAALPAVIGMAWLSALFILTLLLTAAILLMLAQRPSIGVPVLAEFHSGLASMIEPFRNRRFRWLFSLFVVNGIAAAVPATLFMFFVQDQLQLADSAGPFLVLYFVAAAVSMPLWVALAKRIGEARAWFVAMLTAIAAFIWAYGLSAGDAAAFGVICLMSGFALGADLALPPALLAAVIGGAGHSGQREGAYFGAWNWATKMNLALAAGISLPLLGQLGYVPGQSDAQGLAALCVAYALLPCVLKLAAAAILWRAPLRDL